VVVVVLVVPGGWCTLDHCHGDCRAAAKIFYTYIIVLNSPRRKLSLKERKKSDASQISVSGRFKRFSGAKEEGITQHKKKKERRKIDTETAS